MIKILVRIAAVLMAVGIPLTAPAQHALDEPAVIVNGEPIFNWEISLLLPQIQAEMESQGVDPRGKVVVATALRRAVDSLLLAQEARRLGFEPESSRVDAKMAKLAENAGGRGALEAELIKSRVTYDQLRSTVVRADLVQTVVQTRIEPGIEVSEQDIEAYYTGHPEYFKRPDRVRTRHILITVEDGALEDQTAAARKRAAAARERALAGEDFAGLARELSEGPNADRGGDLGFTTRGQMVPEFDEVVWGMEVGEISEVVETSKGYHVIKIEGFYVEPMTTLEEARSLIGDLLRQQRTAEAMASMIASLKEKAEIRDPVEDAGVSTPDGESHGN